jgi:hypothetical protein
MRGPRLRLAVLTAASGIVLSGCAYGMYGDPYGYGGVSVGIGSGYGGYGYDYPYGGGYGSPYGGYGYGYGGYDPFGWYGDYYYPGSGIYVYDRYRTRHEWNDTQRRYWQDRRDRWQRRSGSTTVPTTGDNWSGWDRRHWRDRGTTMPGTTTTTSAETSRRSGWVGNDRRSTSSVTSSGQAVRSQDSTPRHSHEGKRPD